MFTSHPTIALQLMRDREEALRRAAGASRLRRLAHEERRHRQRRR